MRLPRPWDSPGKNTGVGCHFLLQCMKVKSESEIAESCPTLSDPLDCGPPGSSVHGIFQARVQSTFIQIISFHLHSNPIGLCVCQLLSCVPLFVTPWTIACQAPLSMEFSRQEYWSGLPFSSLEDLPDPGIELRSPSLQADSLPSESPGKPLQG